MLTRILIIDDDIKLQSLIAEYLEEYGFKIYSHEDGKGAIEKIKQVNPELILLDIMMPVKDGIETLREIRQLFSIPVIMLTAKGDDTDRIVGLELGADDYISKPFNPRELLARIKAVLRRYNTSNEKPNLTAAKQSISAGGLILDPLTMRLEYKEKTVELSKTEFNILKVLMNNPNIVLSRDAIMDMSQGKDFLAFDRSIDVHISRLRTKVKELCGDKNKIKTIWGTGYMLIS